MQRKLMLLILLVSLALGLISQPAFAQFATPHLVVNTSFLNVRTADGPQYAVVGTVVGGTELPVLGTNSSNSWYLVTTVFGPGWVDVSFTLPRGDFTNVPVINPSESAPLTLPLPVTIGLPGTTSRFSAAAQNGVPAGTRARVNVISVNLRTQPADNAPVIGIVFKDTLPDYAVVGYGGDSRGVPWIAIVVPGLGTGWIETAKTSAIAPAAGTVTTLAPGSLEVPHIVVNTGAQNIRRGPGPQYAVITIVAGGTELSVIGRTSDTSWYLVSGAFGQGWISSEFVLFRGTFSNVPILYSPY
ncbi:MAG: SH3 domain-containing protein [Chloroflexota bacterium]